MYSLELLRVQWTSSKPDEKLSSGGLIGISPPSFFAGPCCVCISFGDGILRFCPRHFIPPASVRSTTVNMTINTNELKMNKVANVSLVKVEAVKRGQSHSYP